MQPITEASNAITEDIDVATPTEIVSLLEKCDQEIFNGYKDFKSLFHEDITRTICDIAQHIVEILKSPSDGAVVFSGCGTSGRIGFITSRTFNELQQTDGQPPVYEYLMAGGDKALFTSQEAIEDDPVEGANELKKVSAGKKKVVYIGITCGLSAPYVAGQLNYCMDHPDVFVPVLLGFNPTQLARNIPIEKWNKTFLQVVERLEQCAEVGRGFILNPIVGPEPITGSSRMKSGTATKILLETILMKAHYLMKHIDRQWNVIDYLHCYQNVGVSVYRQKMLLGQVVYLAGQSLISGGHIYYLGKDNLALLGLIDASECPPTYGATLDDVRGFINDGYATLKNKEGDIAHLGRHFRISTSHFAEEIQPNESDLVISIIKDSNVQLPENVRRSTCKKILIAFGKVKEDVPGFDVVVQHVTQFTAFKLDDQKLQDIQTELFREMATKWCLNAITTGAHILKGKVYKNIMIDVKVSNNKLFHRAIGILARLCNITPESARKYLLKSIYETEELSDDIINNTITNHIVTATPKSKVVPVALLAAVSKISIEETKKALSTQPVVRSAVMTALKKHQAS